MSHNPITTHTKVIKDPIGFAGGDSNLYGYVFGDPVGGLSGKPDINLATSAIRKATFCKLVKISCVDALQATYPQCAGGVVCQLDIRGLFEDCLKGTLKCEENKCE